MAPKKAPKVSGRVHILATFSRPFTKDDFLMHLGRPWAHFWFLVAPFGLPLGSFWLPLVPFWLPLGISWIVFGAIWFTFAHPMVLFSHFGISQPSVIFYILLYFQRKSYRRQGFSCKLFIARWRERGFAALKIIINKSISKPSVFLSFGLPWSLIFSAAKPRPRHRAMNNLHENP